ncbi:MAG: hypothetical protein FWD17_04275 [Polyangiaceae bacterium]|nr:hypothetical protein [Polyangiaceae bacterium]
MKAVGACELPGFLTAAATRVMAEEADQLGLTAYFNTVRGNAYLEPTDAGLPADHPKRLEDHTTVGVLAYDMIPRSSALRALYEWDPLMDFLAAALGEPKLYRYADPMGALNLSVMRPGDYLRWHFDQTGFVTSIALQSAETGGDFEYVPMIRSPNDEQLDRVRALLKGDGREVRRFPMTPGTLLLFMGRYSIHRVTAVGGARFRYVALLGYDTNEGVDSTEHLKKMRYGRTEAQIPPP